jgi:TolB protein
MRWKPHKRQMKITANNAMMSTLRNAIPMTRLAGWLTGVVAAICLILLTPTIILGNWVPQGEMVAYMATTQLYNWNIHLMDVDRGLSHQVTDGTQYERYPTWSPDGRYLLYHSNQRGTYDLYRMDMNTMDSELLDLSIRSQAYNEAMAQWSPDGEHIAYHANIGGTYNVFITDSSGEDFTQLTFNRVGNAIRLSWAPDGEQAVYAADDENGAMNLYTVTLTELLENQPDELIAGESYTFSGNPVPGSQITFTDFDDNWYPSYSPDGSRIVFISNRTGDSDIYVIDADGSNLQNLTNSLSVEEMQPVWTPDGRIVFASDRYQSHDLYIMDADGENLRRLTFDSENSEQAPAWRPPLMGG